MKPSIEKIFKMNFIIYSILALIGGSLNPLNWNAWANLILVAWIYVEIGLMLDDDNRFRGWLDGTSDTIL